MNRPLMTKDRTLRSASEMGDILGKNRLHKLGFDIPWGKVTARQAVMLNKAEEEMPSTSDVAKVDDIRAPRKYRECIKRHKESHCATRGRIL